MNTRPIIAGLLATASLGGGTVALDATTLNEKPVDAVLELHSGIDAPHVIARQVENVVETTLPWKDQLGLTVKYDMGVPSVKEKLADKRKSHAIVEPIENRSDGIDFDIILNEKPDHNTFCYQIDGWEDYNFYKQPALTQEEIDEGASRSDWIVDGYVVYHKTLRDHIEGQTNYETGKFGDIPYPMIWSVNATSTTKHRAEAFNITDGRMCVTVAQKDLDTMKYPVRVDPTFGYTTIGGSSISNCNASGDDIDRIGRGFALPEDGTLDSISAAHLTSGSVDRNVDTKFFVNTENTSTDSHTQIAVASEDAHFYDGPAAFTTINAAGESMTAGNYVLSSVCDGFDIPINSISLTYDTGSSGNVYAEDFALWASVTESPWTETDSASTQVYSIYATYTASGGGGTPVYDGGAILFE